VADSDTAGTLLVVEDDRALNAMLTELFTDEGYAVDVAYDGQRALHLGLGRNYDAAIIDRGLPAVEGAELVALLRSRGVDTPVLLLTARGSVADRVEGLDAGAQDYLVKPFEIPELLARVRALVRRPSGGAMLRVDEWCLNRITRTVEGVAPGGAVELSDREATLLAVLMSAPRQVFTRSQLLAAAFDRADSAGAVDTYVHYLRRKLGNNVVHTVHGVGYRLGSR
jgi:two-component system, OmpR family, response regulator QseB